MDLQEQVLRPPGAGRETGLADLIEISSQMVGPGLGREGERDSVREGERDLPQAREGESEREVERRPQESREREGEHRLE